MTLAENELTVHYHKWMASRNVNLKQADGDLRRANAVFVKLSSICQHREERVWISYIQCGKNRKAGEGKSTICTPKNCSLLGKG